MIGHGKVCIANAMQNVEFKVEKLAETSSHGILCLSYSPKTKTWTCVFNGVVREGRDLDDMLERLLIQPNG